MTNQSVATAVIDMLNKARNTFEFPLILEFLERLPIPEGHAAIEAAVNDAAQRLGFSGTKHHPSNNGYRAFWNARIVDVLSIVRLQAPA